MKRTQQQEPVRGKKKTESGKCAAQRARAKSQKELVEGMIEKLEKKLTSEDVKPSVSDLIRLLQLDKELEDEQPREIKVSWVEPCEEGDASEK
jgi:signal recognition particle GTPase